MNYVVQIVVATLLFISVFIVGWISFNYPKKLNWEEAEKKLNLLNRVSYSLKRKWVLFSTLLREKYINFLVVVVFIVGAQMFMVMFFGESFKTLEGGSYNYSSGECRVVLEGIEKVVTPEECKESFTKFFKLYLSMVTFFSAINVIMVFFVAPLIKRYNVLFNNYEIRT